MISLSNISRQFEKLISHPVLQGSKKSILALLSDDEIHRLMLRAQSQTNNTRHKYDISQHQLGNINSIYRGQGMDYEESRHYQAGDDPRYMNWQLTARTGQHFMKVFREERQAETFILIDRRNTMRFGTKKRLKITQAIMSAAITAFTAQKNNHSIAAVTIDDKNHWFKAKHSKQSVYQLIQHAAKPISPVSHNNKNNQQTSLHEILRTLSIVLTKGTRLYLISDFHDLNEQSKAELYALSAEHQVKAIHITDPAEIVLPTAGKLALHTEKLKNAITINSADSKQRNHFNSSAQSHMFEIKKLLETCAISYQQISTNDDIEEITNI